MGLVDAVHGIVSDQGRETMLCALADIENPGGKGIRVGRRERMFVIRDGEAVYGYMNLCPHQGTTLDWKPDAFLTVEKDYILCATHGAIFEKDTGICTWGPCQGRRLAPIKIRLEAGNVMLDE